MGNRMKRHLYFGSKVPSYSRLENVSPITPIIIFAVIFMELDATIFIFSPQSFLFKEKFGGCH